MKRLLWLVLSALCAAGCEQAGGVSGDDAAREKEREWWEEEDWWEDFEAEEEEEEPPPVVVGLELVSKPHTTLYAKNQDFSAGGWDGLELRWLYSDGSLGSPLEAGEYTINPATVDTAVPGPKFISVKAGEYTTGFQVYVMVSTSVLLSMELTKPPDKTVYYLGEAFSTSGMVLDGTYNDKTGSVEASSVSVEGYDSYKRGSQTVTLRVNDVKASVDVTVKVAASDTVTLATPTVYRTAFIKGKEFDLAASGIKAKVTRGNISVTLSAGNGLYPEDITYNKDTPGEQNLRVTLDEKTATLTVAVVDAEPAVWFDFGYWRHEGDPDGIGPGEGKLYARPNEPLVLAPVRYLIGYNDDHSPHAGTAYTWTVSGGAYDTGAAKNRETFTFTPSAVGNYTVQVAVYGRDFVTGSMVTKSASVQVVSHTGPVPSSKTFVPANRYGARLIRNFAPGQFTVSGTGYGWSLGAVGGYAVWQVNKHQESYGAAGNAFNNWNEPGIVWVQEDRNNNGIPDEMWYEIKGAHDDPANANTLGKLITRRYAITYVNYGGSGGSTNQYGQSINDHIYWADCKGRAGRIPGGWPGIWGVTGSRVTFTGTLLLDNGSFDRGTSEGAMNTGGYVDSVGLTGWSPSSFPLSKAVDAAGKPLAFALSNVRFLKVQTAVFNYGDAFGEISTELTNGTDLGYMTDFPLP